MSDERAHDDVLLSAWLDGELDPVAARALEARIAAEPELAARLRAMQRVDEGLRALPEATVPAGLRERLRARIDAEPPATAHAESSDRPIPLAPPRLARRSRVPAGIGMAAAAALLFLLLRPGPVPEPHWPQGLAGGTPEPREGSPAPATPERLAERAAPDPAPDVTPRDLDLEREWIAALETPAQDDGSAAETPADEREPAFDVADQRELALDVEAEDLPIVEVLDWLEALDELEAVERG